LSPAGLVLLGMFFEIGGAYRAIGGEPLENSLREPRPSRHPRRGCRWLIPRRRQRGMQGAVVGRDDGRLMGPVLVEATLVPEQDVDQFRIERTKPAENNQEVVAGNNPGRVKL